MPIKVAHSDGRLGRQAGRSQPLAARGRQLLVVVVGPSWRPGAPAAVPRGGQGSATARRETTSPATARRNKRGGDLLPEEPRRGRHVEFHRSLKTFEDVSYSLIWNPQTFLDEIDKKYYVARAPGSLCRLADGASVEVRDSTARATSGQGPLRPPHLTSTH